MICHEALESHERQNEAGTHCVSHSVIKREAVFTIRTWSLFLNQTFTLVDL